MTPRPVLTVEQSKNRKLGTCAATYAPQSTCPADCPLRDSGCYAECGRMGLHTSRLNAVSARQEYRDTLQLARLEAQGIDNLIGRYPLRVHVVGDCATPQAAQLVGSAMARYAKRTLRRAWTYTHAWADIPIAAWCGAAVLASCHTIGELKAAWRRGYALSALVSPHKSRKAVDGTVYGMPGFRFIPCPAQFKAADGTRALTCDKCNLCPNPENLRRRKLIVAFQPD